MKIKFTDKATIYKIDSLDVITYGKVVQVSAPAALPQDSSGFILLDDNEQIVNSFEEYTVIFKVVDAKTIQFSSDTNVYRVYWMFNDEGYITHQLVTTEEFENGIVKAEGSSADVVYAPYPVLLDNDGFYLYKVEDGAIVDTTAADKAPWAEEKAAEELAEAKSQKTAEISALCQSAILNGVDVNGSHFSYSFADQNNISNMTTLALQTGLAVPYHADGEDCRLFTRDEIVELYVAEETNVTHNTTYNNQMKAYIDSLEDAAVIQAIKYGDPLTGEYLDTYNAMMAQAQRIIDAFIGRNSAE